MFSTPYKSSRSSSYSRAPVEYYHRLLDSSRERYCGRAANLHAIECYRLDRIQSGRARTLNRELARAKETERSLIELKKQRSIQKKRNNAAKKLQRWWREIIKYNKSKPKFVME